MPVKREYQHLTKRTRQMLSSTETANVDFKREVSGVKSSDIVALANAPHGGTLLIGVDEYTTVDGLQRGKVVGCEVDDNARLMVINKATDCYPNVDVQIYIENLKVKSIMRIEVPSGHLKPYCSPRGEYSIRAEGRNRALYPEELLLLFMDSEGDKFLSRFRTAVSQLEDQVGSINQSLSSDMLAVAQHIHDLDSQLQRTLGRMGRITDSTKKRSRNLLQTLKDSQDSLGKLERFLLADTNFEQRGITLKRLESKVDKLLQRFSDSTSEK
ncbi:helix-turn-helix domain-containing protein [Neptunomonas antarctica]|uniref:Putative DNA-binding domain-containing protein n=1 Tax=Neptunomonas antarctica TaxID=619304 RepID=A0A1N7KCA9_9GAMM|nr:ATP-binding protein [Neptunomonas antarctica]SIS59221.1 Putative DNA-binding domain-containing protein [Neptunomonas antarctica]